MLRVVAEPDTAECKGLQGQTRREAGTQSQRSHMDVRWLGRQFRTPQRAVRSNRRSDGF
jgi:hypothetical protein